MIIFPKDKKDKTPSRPYAASQINKEKPRMEKSRLALFLLMVAFLLGACGVKTHRESFLREDAELGYIRTVAVLPFENNSGDEYAAARARDLTITQALAMGLFDVVDKSLVDSVLREEAIDPGVPLDNPTIRRLGQRLNVQALLMGTVNYAEEGRKGNFVFPELSLTFRLIDVGTSTVLWQASGYGSGYTLWGRLFGLAPRDTFQVGLATIRNMLATLPTRPGD
jgi:TolB-like protein